MSEIGPCIMCLLLIGGIAKAERHAREEGANAKCYRSAGLLLLGVVLLIALGIAMPFVIEADSAGAVLAWQASRGAAFLSLAAAALLGPWGLVETFVRPERGTRGRAAAALALLPVAAAAALGAA